MGETGSTHREGENVHIILTWSKKCNGSDNLKDLGVNERKYFKWVRMWTALN
jgi:hypothetical protein